MGRYNDDWVEGKYGMGLDFDGSNDYVDINSIVDNVSSDTAGTWSAWVKPDDATPNANAYIIGLHDTNVAEVISMMIQTDGKFCAVVYDGGSKKWELMTDNAVFNDNTWVHVAIVQDGTGCGTK